MDSKTEVVVTVPFRAAKAAPRTRRAVRAVKEVRDVIARHMSTESDKIWIDKSLNEKIWERGIQNPPKKLSLKATKFDDGLIEVSLASTKN